MVEAASSVQRGLSAKRRAVLDGALVVFARDGYARASVDAIAAAAGVSVRTIYNHFSDKAVLFAAVVEFSASAVSAAHVEAIDSILGRVRSAEDVEPALVACGVALHTVVPPDAPHWGLVRHVRADVDHVPASVVDIWRRVGPARVKRQLGLHLADLARRGLLHLDDPGLAAAHFSALTGSAVDASLDGEPVDERFATPMAAAVAVFLRGYLPRSSEGADVVQRGPVSDVR